MRKFMLFIPALLLSGAAMAADVPPLTAEELDPAAAAIWSILAGQGPWGVLLFGALGLIWKFGRPYLEAWAKQRKLETLMLAVESGVGGTSAVYIDAIKAAASDGKVTEEEAKNARAMARAHIIAFMRTQGVDVIKDYGEEVVEFLIEYVLGKLKIEKSAAAAVAPLSSELSDSVSKALAPLPELQP